MPRTNKGVRNAWAKKDEEIASLKAEIERMREHEHVHRFAHELCENVGLILANTPFERWPDIAKTAFKHTADRQHVAAYFYKKNLPTD